MNQKLGNKIDATLTTAYHPSNWMNVNGSILVSSVAATSYDKITDPKVKSALETETSNNSSWVRLGLGFSTIDAYKKKKFEFPFDIGLSAQRLLNAKNTANYDRIDLDLKLYF